jgi:hypothetical protein
VKLVHTGTQKRLCSSDEGYLFLQLTLSELYFKKPSSNSNLHVE